VVEKEREVQINRGNFSEGTVPRNGIDGLVKGCNRFHGKQP